MRLRFTSAILAILALSCSTAQNRLMSWREYEASQHHWPFVLRAVLGSGTLYYFGARHTADPRDPQVEQIAAAWDRLKPTRAFNEGGDPPLAPTRDDAVRQYGEAGFVRWLAARDGVHVATLDLPRSLQAQALRGRWSSQEAKAFFVQRALLPCEDRAGCDREAETERIVPIVEATTGLDSRPHTWTELQDSLSRLAPPAGEHHDWFDPTRHGHPFNDMSRRIEDCRDRHMIQTLLDSMRAGHRIFAVAGGSHVVRQEPALRAAGLR